MSTAAKPTAEDFHKLCVEVIEAAKYSSGAGLSWAREYAQAGLRMSTAEEISVQAKYILANLSGWRGPEARAAKAKLKQF